jgi:hypothetical protein
MNCLETRRLAQADPHRLPAPALAHAESCVACAEFVARLRRVDDALAETVARVPVPDGLAERILLRNPGERRPAWPVWLHPARWARQAPWLHGALAAGLVLGVAALLALPSLRSDAGLARAALAHVEEEPDTLRAAQVVTGADLAAALDSVGARLRGDIGRVTYLGSCPLPGGEGKHLVVSSPLGRYSLVLMPARAKGRATAEQGMHAAVAKPAARGSYAIVAAATPDLTRIEQMLDRGVIWSAKQ